MKKIFLAIILMISISNVFAQDADQKAAGEIADKLFEAMRLKSYDGIRTLFLEGGKLTALDKPKSGEGFSTTRNFTGEQFPKMISEAKAPEFIEKMPEKVVRIYGDAAVVYGKYTFHVGDKFSHCGVNAFHLWRSENGWKIANGTTTLETANCETPKDFSSDKTNVIASVNKLWELMTAHNPAEIVSLHTPESQLTAFIAGKDGKSRIENISREAFSKFFEKKTADLQEKMYDEKIEVFGDFASVDGRYAFLVNGKVAHCGMNSFHLTRTAEGWKLGNSISTIEPNGCTEKEKAMGK